MPRPTFPEQWDWLDAIPQDPVFFEKQLRKEMCDGHVLEKESFRACARAYPNDDVMFELNGNRFAIVHLTYFQSKAANGYPSTTIYETLEDAVKSIYQEYENWD